MELLEHASTVGGYGEFAVFLCPSYDQSAPTAPAGAERISRS